jgi:predicted molibdopterin-dependent oxidoreductase YjgC
VGDDSGSGGLDGLAQHTGALLVLGDELADVDPDFGRRSRLFVYIGQALSDAARNAHFVLPSATFAEMEGSFTNIDNRVQRFWPALLVPGMARPAWQILGVLLAGLNESSAPATPGDAFSRIGSLAPASAGLRFEDLGAGGQPLPEGPAVAGRSR